MINSKYNASQDTQGSPAGDAISSTNIATWQDRLSGLSDDQLKAIIQGVEPGFPSHLAFLAMNEGKSRTATRAAVENEPQTTVKDDVVAGLGSISEAPQIPGGGITESVPAQAQAVPIMAAQGGLIRLQGGGSVPDEEEELASRIASNSMTEKDSNNLNYFRDNAPYKLDAILNKARDIQHNDPLRQAKEFLGAEVTTDPAHYIDLAGMGLKAIGATDMGKKQRRRVGEDLWKSAKQGANKVGKGLESLEEMWDKRSWENKPYREANERKHSDLRYRELLEEHLPNLTKEQLDAKFNNQTGPMPPSTIDQLKGWLGGVTSDSKTETPKSQGTPPGSKPPTKTKDKDKDKDKQAPMGIQELIAQAQAQAVKNPKGKGGITGGQYGMSKDDAKLLMALGGSMLSNKDESLAGTFGGGVNALLAQDAVNRKQRTDNLLAEAKLAAAGGASIKDAMTMQTSVQKSLLDVKQKQAALIETGNPEAAEALNAEIARFEGVLHMLMKKTGYYTALPASGGNTKTTTSGMGFFDSAIAGVKELVS